jgi:MauM/NapG family ferredoxin protein
MKKLKKINWSSMVRIRKTVQVIMLTAFLTLLFVFQHKNVPNEIADIFFRFDPLVAIGAMLASRSFIPGMLPALAILSLTIVFGRVWCGWICPMGTISDFFSLRKKRTKKQKPRISLNRETDTHLRRIKYVFFIVILVAAVFGNLTLFVADPIALITRFYSATLVPVVNTIVTGATTAAYKQGIFTDAIDAIEGAIRGNILPVRTGIIEAGSIIGIVFLSVILLNLIAARFFCRYVCPLGGMLSLLSGYSLFKRKVADKCSSCSGCEEACPMGIIDQEDGYSSDPKECIACFKCLADCRNKCTDFSATFEPGKKQPYDPGKREFLGSIGIAAIGTALLAADGRKLFADDYLLRPPGSLEEAKFLSQCVRCSKCINVCPTSGLVPSLNEAGWAGLWAPRLLPRSGYCDFGCNACGRVCPTGAIANLELESKRKAVIGKAYIDRSKCIAWSNNDPCAVCVEFCPVRPKAIQVIEQKQIDPRTGEPVVVPLPYILKENCIGCGTCENGCPVIGQAAIRVKRL